MTDKSEPPLVLYVSNDTAYLNTVRRNLCHAGFSVVTTRSTAEAVELTSQSDVDAILSDYNLPQTDALAFFEQLQQLHGDNTPPTLIVGDHDVEALKSRCIAVGTEGLHVKSQSAEQLIDRVTSILRNESKRDQIMYSSPRISLKSGIDPLTQVSSREYFKRRLNGESVASYRDQSPLSLVMLTLDKFSQIEEQFGKTKAESTLAQTARLVEGELRSRDCVARYGHYTFVIILPDTPIQAAKAVGRRLLRRLSSTEFGDLDLPISLTVSVGATCRPQGTESPPKELINQALHASNAAVKMGGNRVIADTALTGRPVVLLVGEPSDEVSAVIREIKDLNVELRTAISFEETREMLQDIPVAMLLVPNAVPGLDDGVELLEWARNRFPSIKRVFISGKMDHVLMTKAINRAAIHYFIPIPWNLNELPGVIDGLLFS